MARVWGRVSASLGVALPGFAGVALLGFAGLAGFAAVAPWSPAPASAHARLVGSSPVDGSTVERAPDEVSIVLDARPATIEGDPLQVVGPDGRRVDAGDARADAEGSTLTISLDPAAPRPSGEYQIAYRVVSEDTHVIAGRLTFEARLPVVSPGAASRDPADVSTAWNPAGRRVAPDQSPDGADEPPRLARQADDPRPRLIAGGAIVLALAALALRLAQRDPKLERDLHQPTAVGPNAGAAARHPARPAPGTGRHAFPGPDDLADLAPGPPAASPPPDWRSRAPAAQTPAATAADRTGQAPPAAAARTGETPATRTVQPPAAATTRTGEHHLPTDWRNRPPTGETPATHTAQSPVAATTRTGEHHLPTDWRNRPPTGEVPATRTGEHRNLPARMPAPLPPDWRTRPPTGEVPATAARTGEHRLPPDWRTQPPGPPLPDHARELPPVPPRELPPARRTGQHQLPGGWRTRPPEPPAAHTGEQPLPADWRTRPPTGETPAPSWRHAPQPPLPDHARELPPAARTTGQHSLSADWRNQPPTSQVPATGTGEHRLSADWRNRPPTGEVPATRTGEHRNLPATTGPAPPHTGQHPLPTDWRNRPPTGPVPATRTGEHSLPADWRSRPPRTPAELPAPAGDWPYRPNRQTPEDVARAAISSRPDERPIWEIAAPDVNRPPAWPYRSGPTAPGVPERPAVAWDATSGDPVTGEWAPVPERPSFPSTWGDDGVPGPPVEWDQRPIHDPEPPRTGGLRPPPSWEVVDQDDPAIAGWRGAVEWGAGARGALRQHRDAEPPPMEPPMEPPPEAPADSGRVGRKARRQRAGRRSSPVGAGLRLPRGGNRVGGEAIPLPPVSRPERRRFSEDEEAEFWG
jgi:methionine-rich copper-binding protein CopC